MKRRKPVDTNSRRPVTLPAQAAGLAWCATCQQDRPETDFDCGSWHCAACVHARENPLAGTTVLGRPSRARGAPYISTRPADMPPVAEGFKWCSRCQRDLPHSAFGYSRSDTLSSYCKPCSRSYNNRKPRLLRYYKQMCGCVDCGEIDPYQLEFDHVFGEKSFTIGSGRDHTWEEIIQEVAKCVVRCKDCHGERSRFTKQAERRASQARRLTGTHQR